MILKNDVTLKGAGIEKTMLGAKGVGSVIIAATKTVIEGFYIRTSGAETYYVANNRIESSKM